MGTSQSIQVNGFKSTQYNYKLFDVREWIQIPNYSYTDNIDPYYGSNYNILVFNNQLNNNSKKPSHSQQIQRYQLFFNTYQQYKHYSQLYQWRRLIKYLVQPKLLQQRTTKNICSTFHEATLYLQRIPIRACEITDIPLDEGLYLLYCSFMGFRKIYQKTGYFQITLDMICFNKEAMVKVWLNNNLAKNLPEVYLLNQNYGEYQFIMKILQLCEPLIDFAGIQQKFSQFLSHLYDNYNKNVKLNHMKSSIHQHHNKSITDSLKPKSPNITERSSNHQYDKQKQKICKYSTIGLKNQGYSSKSNYSSYASCKNTFNNNTIDIKNFITFDKIIDHFQQYLKKYKLIISRQMKSIKDLFRIQKKIQCEDDIKRLYGQNNMKKEHKQVSIDQQILILNLESIKSQKNQQNNRNLNQNNTIKKRKTGGLDRKNTKRTDTNNTDRTIIQKVGYQQNNIFGYKSSQYQNKYNNNAIKKPIQQKRHPPQISFIYRPITITHGHHQYLNSPQHMTMNKHIYQRPRDRIKTMDHNVSINMNSSSMVYNNDIYKDWKIRQKNCSKYVYHNNIHHYQHNREKSSSTNFSQNSRENRENRQNSQNRENRQNREIRENIQYIFHSPTNVRFGNGVNTSGYNNVGNMVKIGNQNNVHGNMNNINVNNMNSINKNNANNTNINNLNVFKKKTECDEGIVEKHNQINKLKEQIVNNINNDNINSNSNNTNSNLNTSLLYYASQKQYQIDDQILKDLSKFNIINNQNNNIIAQL